MEALRDSHGVLSGHGIGHQQHLVRLQGLFQPHQFTHHLVVDLEPPRRVDHYRACPRGRGGPNAGLHHFDDVGRSARVLIGRTMHPDPDLLGELPKLLLRRRAVGIGRHQERGLLLLLELPRELGTRGGLS